MSPKQNAKGTVRARRCRKTIGSLKLKGRAENENSHWAPPTRLEIGKAKSAH